MVKMRLRLLLDPLVSEWERGFVTMSYVYSLEKLEGFVKVSL